MAYEREMAVLMRAVREAGAAIRRHYDEGAQVYTKADNSPVTEADLAANAILMDQLRAAFPDDSPTTIVTRLTSTGAPITDTRNGLTRPRIDPERPLTAAFAVVDPGYEVPAHAASPEVDAEAGTPLPAGVARWVAGPVVDER